VIVKDSVKTTEVVHESKLPKLRSKILNSDQVKKPTKAVLKSKMTSNDPFPTPKVENDVKSSLPKPKSKKRSSSNLVAKQAIKVSKRKTD
jgi:hypothetical protein